jgi:hypothetical protein
MHWNDDAPSVAGQAPQRGQESAERPRMVRVLGSVDRRQIILAASKAIGTQNVRAPKGVLAV